ncbi:hypothetical protein DFP72DRAFT_851852 [Ephemerocybe angulata]|uniref:Uncharacterized protein n=1 Tax=Ephemerocybe angulata TaxID=980116 RepID=A0A8H6HN97_9AGAR|nr:hypothetical protein DFP72DRAFT_851852 [Tulosesus angulatus]
MDIVKPEPLGYPSSTILGISMKWGQANWFDEPDMPVKRETTVDLTDPRSKWDTKVEAIPIRQDRHTVNTLLDSMSDYIGVALPVLALKSKGKERKLYGFHKVPCTGDASQMHPSRTSSRNLTNITLPFKSTRETATNLNSTIQLHRESPYLRNVQLGGKTRWSVVTVAPLDLGDGILQDLGLLVELEDPVCVQRLHRSHAAFFSDTRYVGDLEMLHVLHCHRPLRASPSSASTTCTATTLDLHSPIRLNPGPSSMRAPTSATVSRPDFGSVPEIDFDWGI